MLHALLAFVCGLTPGSALARLAGWLALAGGSIFALALYAVGPLHMSAFGMVAPIGGMLMICAWVALAIAAARSPLIQPSSSL